MAKTNASKSAKATKVVTATKGKGKSIPASAPIVRTKTHYATSLMDLIKSKKIVPGKTALVARYHGVDYNASVGKDGIITVKNGDAKGEYVSLSTAGTQIRGGSQTNGWIFWNRVEKDGSRTPLASLRAN